MAKKGERRRSGGDYTTEHSSAKGTKLEDLGITKKQSHNWQKLALSMLIPHVQIRRLKHPPELNPVENIWQFMRDNWLSNHIFKSHEDIVDHCCFAWNKLIDIGIRDWAYRS